MIGLNLPDVRRNGPARRARRPGHVHGFTRGFTLVEMLVVVGIIIILVSMLFPVINKVRMNGYMAQTAHEISVISNACGQYYTDFRAFPGPLSNDEIEGNNADSAIGITNSATGSAISVNSVTGSENLVLGILGGLNYTTTASAPYIALQFNPNEVGMGTVNLYPGGNSERTQYFSLGVAPTEGILISKGSYVDANGVAANDTAIPEFIDYYPQGLPLLYARARTGAPGIIAAKQSPSACQYDTQEFVAYTGPSSGQYLGMLTGQHGLQANPGSFIPGSTMNNQFPNNAGAYFMNSTIPVATMPGTYASGLSQWIQTNGRPRQVDQFVLISAGPDGIYGTIDDQTNFGTMQ